MQHLRPRPETVVMSQVSYVYLDNGRQTLRLGRSAYDELRARSVLGQGDRRHAEFLEPAGSSEQARSAFEAAEEWPPPVEGSQP
ncbi:hypothetical protein SAMN05216467_0036 [Cellulomonas sp. KH9]|nr:hypothetical protein SAMN05216467_0036 [Cellulomonas sp. KH9]